MKIHHQVLIRVPQLSLNTLLHEKWEDLKDSIQISSLEFYQQIKDVTAGELDQLPRAVFHTIWKYYNRSKYRATPYGTFAGCGLVNLSNGTDKSEILIDNQQIIHRYPCWTITDKIAEQGEALGNDTIVFTNQTYYQVGVNLRFIAREDNTFILAETENSEIYTNILQLSKKPVLVDELLKTAHHCTIADIQQMVDLQLLLTSNTPNIIGEDYFRRIGYAGAADDAQYVLAERKVLQSGFSTQAFTDLPELVRLMQHLVPDPPAHDLEQFKRAFTRKFEDRMVPLMVALDPELGIGYGDLYLAPGLEAPIAAPATSEPNDKRALIEMLFKSMVSSGCKVIRLDQLPALVNQNPPAVPGSLGVLCSLADDLLVIEQIASPSSTRLLGRFSMIENDIGNLCREIAAYESAANPDVLFFDIGYTDELSVDNVNRRRCIYSYQLSLLNYDDTNGALDLSNIDVTVSRNEIILHDRKIGKRVVPRLSSSYNYKRSSLSVYRFLNDLQYDGLKINFNLKLSESFPDEDYYPRVQFKQIILSPAQWHISAAAYKSYANGVISNDNLRGYLKSIGLEKYAVTRTEDRTMVFDLDSNGDLKELLHLLEKFDSFLVEEGFIPSHPVVADLNGNKYAQQFILTLVNDQQLYHTNIQQTPAAINIHHIRPVFLPMQEWLYFKIYAHPLRIDELLKGPVHTLVSEHQDKFLSWFFVRYDENGTHLRLRFRINQQSDLSQIVRLVNNAMQEEVISGVISDIKIATYKREVERYGADLITGVEDHYWNDSEYVLSVLRQEVGDDQKYQLCINLLLSMLGALGEKTADGIAYIDQVCHAFAEEYRITRTGFKELNKTFRRISNHVFPDQEDICRRYEPFKTSAINLLKQCQAGRRLKLMADLVHMHVNRIFPAHQRCHEMMIYYFSQKMLLRQNALSKWDFTHYHQK